MFSLLQLAYTTETFHFMSALACQPILYQTKSGKENHLWNQFYKKTDKEVKSTYTFGRSYREDVINRWLVQIQKYIREKIGR